MASKREREGAARSRRARHGPPNHHARRLGLLRNSHPTSESHIGYQESSSGTFSVRHQRLRHRRNSTHVWSRRKQGTAHSEDRGAAGSAFGLLVGIVVDKRGCRSAAMGLQPTAQRPRQPAVSVRLQSPARRVTGAPLVHLAPGAAAKRVAMGKNRGWNKPHASTV